MIWCFKVVFVLLLVPSLFADNNLQLDGSVTTLNQDYDVLKSIVLVRRVSVPTRANLDLAAYAENIMLYDTASFEVTIPEEKLSLKKLNYENTLIPSSVCNLYKKTKIEKSSASFAVHWSALKDYLMKWNFEVSQGLVEGLDKIREEKWGNEDAALPLAEIGRMYIKPEKKKTEIWVRVDIKPWAASLFPFISDENGDGFPEFYGKVNPKLYNEKIIEAITVKYAQDTLSREAILTWANELASFWYPSFNTDIYRIATPVWPDDFTSDHIKKEMAGLTVLKPMVFIKGKPFGEELFNIIVVDNMEGDIDIASSSTGSSIRHGIDSSVEPKIRALKSKLDNEQLVFDSSFAVSVRKILKSEPDEIKGFVGKDGFLFFRNTLNYLQGGDITNQPAGKNPIPSIVACKNALKEIGVDFLFVPVPVKAEVYPEKLISSVKNKEAFVNPYNRKFIKTLLDEGVEVVDLLPAFLEEKKKDCKECEPVFQRQDTHWGSRGIDKAAELIAERLKAYTWYDSIPKEQFTSVDTKFVSQGDIVARLKTSLQSKFPPPTLLGKKVITSEGIPYQDNKDSPVLLITDSFGGVYQRTGCKSAGVSAHIAKNIGAPVQLLVSYGGGPLLIGQLKKMGLETVSTKRIVVWMMVARDLYNYHEDWEILEKLEKKIVDKE